MAFQADENNEKANCAMYRAIYLCAPGTNREKTFMRFLVLLPVHGVLSVNVGSSQVSVTVARENNKKMAPDSIKIKGNYRRLLQILATI